MKHLKPVYISILTIVIFIGGLLIGMQTDWWQTEGRKTPLDEQTSSGSGKEEQEEETNLITGETTLAGAISLGLTQEQLSEALAGSVKDEDPDKPIKDIVTERGLKFGNVKSELNAMLSN